MATASSSVLAGAPASAPSSLESAVISAKEVRFKQVHEKEIAQLADKVTIIPNWPKPGIRFQNYWPLMADGRALQTLMTLLTEYYKDEGIQAVVGLEARGFTFGTALALTLQVGFLPVRKPSKLPGATFESKYEKEYGPDTMHFDREQVKDIAGLRVLIVDDLIATGGTARAGIDLVRQAGGIPVEFLSLLEIPQLGGRATLGIPSLNLMVKE